VCVCILGYPACIAHAPYYIVIYGLAGSTILLQIISQTERFSREKKSYWIQNKCSDFLYYFCLKHFTS